MWPVVCKQKLIMIKEKYTRKSRKIHKKSSKMQFFKSRKNKVLLDGLNHHSLHFSFLEVIWLKTVDFIDLVWIYLNTCELVVSLERRPRLDGIPVLLSLRLFPVPRVMSSCSMAMCPEWPEWPEWPACPEWPECRTSLMYRDMSLETWRCGMSSASLSSLLLAIS